ncbi:MAG: hypothetical protein HKL86_07585 [Acidimicrobiaceae bacterium]|nr:hypothetical protein [Acidimicrobiaceae bacterium]
MRPHFWADTSEAQCVWGLDLRNVETEFTLVGVNSALDEFPGLAAQKRTESEVLATEYGRHLARSLVL